MHEMIDSKFGGFQLKVTLNVYQDCRV